MYIYSYIHEYIYIYLAQVCGMIDTADELIMVDGHKVSALTAIAALRGSDSAASVVSLLLRKSGR